MTVGKRVFDVVTASIALLVLAPVIVVVALLVRVKMGSPVIFRAARLGIGGKPFDLYKFRTMSDERHESGELLDDQHRLSQFGTVLRRWSLDELPALLNVIRGEVSLVGPRPLPVRYKDRFTPEQGRRHDVVPGVTGWAQANGRNALSWPERFELDLWYADNRSFLLDLRILFMTAARVMRGDGIAASGHVTMPEFRGDED